MPTDKPVSPARFREMAAYMQEYGVECLRCTLESDPDQFWGTFGQWMEGHEPGDEVPDVALGRLSERFVQLVLERARLRTN
jgi:hypothetical protein